MVLLLLSQLFLVGIVLASPLDSSKNENKHIVDVINEAKSTFTARHYPQFDNLSKDELRKLFGNKDGKRKPQKTTPSDYRDLSESSIVDTFDARDNWPKCIEAISDIGVQGNCSASWAFATTASIRDRRCIAGLPSEIPLSADDLLTCCEDCLADPADACSGTDDVSQAFQYFIYQGVVTGGAYRSYKGCRPYQISPTGQVPVAAKKCVKRCQSNYGKQYEDDKNKIADQKVFSLSNAAAKNELLQGGSLVAEFDLYEDFLHYSGGVYRHLIGDFVGKAHAKVIGWGTHGNGQAYWLATFSLGVDWGVNGTFKILAGVNEVNFETSFIAGYVNISQSNPSSTTKNSKVQPTTVKSPPEAKTTINCSSTPKKTSTTKQETLTTNNPTTKQESLTTNNPTTTTKATQIDRSGSVITGHFKGRFENADNNNQEIDGEFQIKLQINKSADFIKLEIQRINESIKLWDTLYFHFYDETDNKFCDFPDDCTIPLANRPGGFSVHIHERRVGRQDNILELMYFPSFDNKFKLDNTNGGDCTRNQLTANDGYLPFPDLFEACICYGEYSADQWLECSEEVPQVKQNNFNMPKVSFKDKHPNWKP